MKLKLCILAALSLLMISGCGLVSGTAFVSQEVDEDIYTDTRPSGIRGGNGHLDVTRMDSIIVDLTDNGDWDKFTIEGVEDGCINMIATNHLDQDVSGEIWIVPDISFNGGNNPDAVKNAPGAFRVFHGLALSPLETRHFLCFETIALLENTDRLVEVVRRDRKSVV